jgi:hypothetical protein
VETPTPTPIAETPPSTPVITDGQLGDILFQDDFEGGISLRWMFTSDRYIVPWVAEEFEGRTVFHSLPPTPPGEVSAAEIQDTNWDNYAIQFDFRFLKPDRFDTYYFSLRGRNAQCSPTIRARQAYDVTVSPDRSLLQKMICREGGHEEVAVSDWDFDPNAWHTLQYNLVGNHIQLLIDGKTFIDHTDQQDWLTGGDLWIETGADAEILFDNFKVYEIIPLGESQVPIGEQRSLCLDGIDSYVEVPYSESLALEQALTLEAWVQVSRFAVEDCRVYGLCGSVPIINQGHRGSSAGNYTLFVSPEQLGFVFQPLDSKLTAPVGDWQEWNHIAVTHTFGSGGQSRLYLNGEPLEQLQWTNDKGGLANGNDPFPNQVSPYYFGKMEPHHLFLSGCIDEIRIWDRVRTQAEIQETMRSELSGDEDGLAGYWKFNGAEDSTLAVDSSSNGNDGRLLGDARLQTTNVPISPPRR